MPDDSQGSGTDRRTFIKLTSGTVAVGSMGLAGCSGDGGGNGNGNGGGNGNGNGSGGGNGNGSGSTDTPTPAPNYPQENLLWINPTSPSGGFGTIGQRLTEDLPSYLPNQDTEIEFRTIDNWVEGVQQVYRAEPDGYTFGWANVPGNVPTQVLQGVDYGLKEWEWICRAATMTYTFVVAPDSEYQSPEDLMPENAGTLKVGATGGTGQLTTILGLSTMGVDIEVVGGYGSSVESLAALQRGELDIQAMARRSVPYMQNLEDGNVRPLFTFGDEPTEQTVNAGFEDIPTAQSMGYEDLRNFGLNRLIGGPPGFPQDKKQALTDAFISLMESDEIQSWSEETGNPIIPDGPEACQQAVDAAFNLVENNRETLAQYYG